MKKFVYLNVCMRGAESRTLRIANPLIDELQKYGQVHQIDVCDLDLILYNKEEFNKKVDGYIPNQYIEWSKEIANCDGLFIAAPLWDMSFPAILKVFLEDISLFEIMFTQADTYFKGLAKCPFIYYISTCGMTDKKGGPLQEGVNYLKAISELWGIKDVYSLIGVNYDFLSQEEIDLDIERLVKEGKELLQKILK